MRHKKHLTAKRFLTLIPLLVLWNCGAKKPVSPSGSPSESPSRTTPTTATLQTGQKMEFFPAVERARKNIASLIQLSESRVDATFTAVKDSILAQQEKTELEALQQQENGVFQDLIVTLDMFLQYVPTGGIMDQNVTRGRNNTAAKYDSYAKSIEAGITDQFLDALEKTAIESNARSLISELQFIESSLPLPFDSLKVGPTFMLEVDSVDLFFEVVRDIEDMTKELEELRVTLQQYQKAKSEMDDFHQREKVLTEEIQKRKAEIGNLNKELTTTQDQQKEGFDALDSKLDTGSDSLGIVIRQVDSAIRTDLSNIASGIADSLTARKQASDSLFFQVGTNMKLFQEDIDSLKGVVRYYDIAEKGLPEIDEDVLNILKLPALRHKITLKNGTVLIGQILTENLDVIILQTAVGRLIVEKNSIARYDEKFYPRPKVEFEGDYSFIEFEDREEFTGVVRNVGKKKADFVKISFFLWDATANPVGVGSAFVHGVTTVFSTGVISDSSIGPGETATYHVIVEKEPGKKVAYRTNEVKWREYR